MPNEYMYLSSMDRRRHSLEMQLETLEMKGVHPF